MNPMDIINGLGGIEDGFVMAAAAFRQGKGKLRSVAKKRLWLLAAVIALALLLVGCTVVYVVTGSSWYAERWYRNFFSTNASTENLEDLTVRQQQIWDRGLVKLDQSVTCNGYTVTLESGISDGYRMLIKYRIDGPEGTVLNGDGYQLRYTTDMQIPHFGDGDYSLGVYGEEPLQDENPDDGTVYGLFEWLFQPPEGSEFSLTDGTQWNITVHEILEENRSAEKNAFTTLCQGTWAFQVTFSEDLIVTNSTELVEKPIRCAAVRDLGNRRFPLKVRVTSFELRSLSATLRYNMPLTGSWDGITLGPISLVMRDGTKIEAHCRSTVYRGDHEESLYVFDRPIAPEDVAGIEFS